MDIIWQTLVQFMFRLTFGVALAMGVTPPRLVPSGFYRVHLWVLMGVTTTASLAIYSARESYAAASVEWRVALALGIAIAVLCYAGSVIWLYERPQAGVQLLFVVAILALIATILVLPWSKATTSWGLTLALLDLISGGLLLGTTLSAMFLGHWYLNTPNMELMPLKRLVLMIGIAVVLRTICAGFGLALHASMPPLSMNFWILVSFRWLSGLLGALMMALLAWHALKVPNTQSATGILYAGVILTFIGELVSQLLSVHLLYPV